MIHPDTLREIQRLMDESSGAMSDPRINERRIAALLGIDASALRGNDRSKDESGSAETPEPEP